jgi:uncharacterized protein YggE
VAVPTLFVMGDAEREIVPDRVVVSVTVQTPVLHSSQEALSWAAQARRRVIDHLEGALPGAAISDGRITTREEQRRVEEERPGRTETRWKVAGCTVGPVVSIGEHGPRPEPRDDGMRIFASHDDPSTAADELEEALGELRPEPELRRAQVPVRVALA